MFRGQVDLNTSSSTGTQFVLPPKIKLVEGEEKTMITWRINITGWFIAIGPLFMLSVVAFIALLFMQPAVSIFFLVLMVATGAILRHLLKFLRASLQLR